MNNDFDKRMENFSDRLKTHKDKIPLQEVKPIDNIELIKVEVTNITPLNTRQLNVEIDEDLFIRLKMLSAKKRIPLRILVERALDLYLKIEVS